MEDLYLVIWTGIYGKLYCIRMFKEILDIWEAYLLVLGVLSSSVFSIVPGSPQKTVCGIKT